MGGYVTIEVSSTGYDSDSDDLLVNACDNDLGGSVDLSDFSKFAVDFGTNVQRSDYDFDFVVDLADFSQFAVEFGSRQTC